LVRTVARPVRSTEMNAHAIKAMGTTIKATDAHAITFMVTP
jgi:hypothetical protein